MVRSSPASPLALAGDRDRQPFAAQVVEIELLELQPALLQHLQRRVAPSGRCQPAVRHQQIELREMAAAEMAGEVARRQLEPIVDIAHDRPTISIKIGDRATTGCIDSRRARRTACQRPPATALFGRSRAGGRIAMRFGAVLAGLALAALPAGGDARGPDAGRRRAGACGRRLAVDGLRRARAAAAGLCRRAAAPPGAERNPRRHLWPRRDRLCRMGLRPRP